MAPAYRPASANDISLYGSSAETLVELLAVVQRASAAILDALLAEKVEQLSQGS